MREADRTMDTLSAMPVSGWHIPRPSLSGSGGGGGSASGDSRARGGSSSSQGSASNHSTHSVSSGSLLLSAAHLARSHGAGAASTSPAPAPTDLIARSPTDADEAPSTYSTNLTTYVGSQHDVARQHRKLHRTDAVQVTIPEEAADPFWSGVKRGGGGGGEGEADAGSVASSTHFTVVNGFTRHRGAGKPHATPWCCNSSHQVTVLVVTMTVLFSACILAAICFVEMRLRRDSDYRFS